MGAAERLVPLALCLCLVAAQAAAANGGQQQLSAASCSCSNEVNPVCSGNVTFGSECIAQCQGFMTASPGICPEDEGMGAWGGNGTQDWFWERGNVSLAAMRAFALDGFVYVYRVNLTNPTNAPSLSNVKLDESAIQDLASSYRPGLLGAVRVTAQGCVYEQATTGILSAFPEDNEGAVVSDDYNSVSQEVPAFVPQRQEEDDSTGDAGEVVEDQQSLDGAALAGRRLRWTLGQDNRQPLKDEQAAFPYSSAGQLRIKDEKGREYTCSGALVGPSSVLTAAHCVFDTSSGRYFKEISFSPGLNAPETPYPPVKWLHATTYRQFRARHPPDVNYDLAVVHLAQPIGQQLGFFGYAYKCGPRDMKLTTVGYPNDRGVLGSAYMEMCTVAPKFDVCQSGNGSDWSTITQPLQPHSCDSALGQSGASMWDANNRVRMVLVAESATCDGDKGCQNFGVLINQFHWAFIKRHVSGQDSANDTTPGSQVPAVQPRRATG